MAEPQMIQSQMPSELRWMAPEYHHHEKDEYWNKFLILGAIILGGLSIWQRNFLFAIFIVIATGLLNYWGHRKPEIVEFLLDEKGFTVHGERRDYKDIHEFSISINENTTLGWNKLKLRMNTKLIPHLIVAIPKHNTQQIRMFLSEYVQEIEHDDSLIDVLADFFKF